MPNILVQALFTALAQRGDRAAVIDSGARLSANKVLDLTKRRVEEFRGDGIDDQSVVLVPTDREFEYWIDVMALWTLDAVAVPLEPAIHANEFEHLQQTTRPSHVSCKAALPANLQTLVEQSVIAASGDQRLRDTALVLFTSGSTGLPKAVPLSAQALLANARATLEATGLHKHSHLFAPVRFRFISGVSHFLAAVLGGVIFEGLEHKLIQSDLVTYLQNSGADAFGGSPVQARWLAEANASKLNLKWLMSSGDHLPVAVIDSLRSQFSDIKIVTAYGLTELAGRYCILAPSDLDTREGSVGLPIAGAGLTVDGDADSGSGSVIATGELVFDGYLDYSGNRFGLNDDGSFDTGDVGRMSDDGYLWLSGRADDVFKSGGLKVSSQSIVEVLMASGLFADVAVVSMPHESLGQVPGVVYVLKPGVEFKKGPVLRQIREALPSNHLPHVFVERQTIERTGSGKVRRQKAREALGVADA